jgi:hypothetical protein
MSLVVTEEMMTSAILDNDTGSSPSREDARRLIESINDEGYAHIKTFISSERFESLSRRLGNIVFRTTLQIAPGRKSVVYNRDEIGFHTDNPKVRIIGWHCVRQDEVDGSSLLLDTRDIAEHFPPSELAVLETIELRCPDLELHDPDAGKEAYFKTQLLSWKGDEPQVYFVRWLLLSSYDSGQLAVLDKFVRYLRHKEEHEVFSIRLKEGEALFINNRRLLHGRGAIGENSSRLIERVWLSDPDTQWP